MLPTFAKDEIKVLRAELSGASRIERDWANATSHTITGCSVQVATSNAEVVSRESASIEYYCYAPIDSDIEYTDRIEFDGVVYLIVDMPKKYVSPYGMTSYLLVMLKRWVG